MAYCQKKGCLKELLSLIENGDIFKKKLTKSAFRCFSEVISNVGRKKLKKCFSKKSRAGLKKNRRLIEKILSRKYSEKCRRKALQSIPKKLKKLLRGVLLEFQTNCLVEDVVD